MKHCHIRHRSISGKTIFAAASVGVVLSGLTIGMAHALCTFALDTTAQWSMFNLPHKEFPQLPEYDSNEQAKAAQWFRNKRQPVGIRSFDGLKLHGWLLEPCSTDQSAKRRHLYAICCHGYTGTPEEMAKWAYHYACLGFGVLIPAQRGHELSEGRYVGMGYLERNDLLDWIHLIIEADHSARILLHGNSMGAATVMMTAGDPRLPRNVVAAVSDCGYASVIGQFTDNAASMFHLPRHIAYLMVKAASMVCMRKAGYSFEEASCTKALHHAKIPMLFIHGGGDSFVRPYNLALNYEACASIDREKLLIPKAEHTMSASTDPVRYWKRVTSFVMRVFDL